MISTAAGLGALLHVLSVAPLLECLPGHVLLDVLALLPGHGVAHLVADVAALLIILELGHGGGRVAAVLLEILLRFISSQFFSSIIVHIK